ncbi:MAG: ATP-binding protein [Bdellovibrionales bacterium]
MVKELIHFVTSDGLDNASGSSFSEQLKDHVLEQIIKRNLLSCWVEFSLLLASIFATPIERKSPEVVYGWLAIHFALLVAQILLGRLSAIKKRVLTLWVRGLSIGLWSVMAGYFLTRVGISWTSFYLLLSSLGVALVQVIVFSPKMRVTWLTQLLAFTPLVGVHLFSIQGLQGRAIAIFLVLAMITFIAIGKKLNIEFWVQSIDRTRLKAILEAIPGALTWFDFRGTQLGSNSLFNQYFENIEKDGFRDLVVKLFDQEENDLTKSIHMGKKHFHFVGRKYNFDSEAIFMGLDLSKEQFWQEKLEKERVQYLKSNRLIAMGELMTMMPHSDGSTLQSLTHLLAPDLDRVPLGEIHETLTEFYGRASESKGVAFRSSDLTDSLKSHLVDPEITLVLTTLIQNALDAVANQSEKKVNFEITEEREKILMTVSDSGEGIEDFFQDLVFEPLFTTKNETGSGTGLTLANEIVSNLEGAIFYQRDSGLSKFIIALPLD